MDLVEYRVSTTISIVELVNSTKRRRLFITADGHVDTPRVSESSRVEYVDDSKPRRRFYQLTGKPKRTEQNLTVRLTTEASRGLSGITELLVGVGTELPFSRSFKPPKTCSKTVQLIHFGHFYVIVVEDKF